MVKKRISERERLTWGLPKKYDLTRLRLHKGDIVVVRADVLLNKEQLTIVRELMQKHVGPDIKVLVLSSILTLAVVPGPRSLDQPEDKHEDS